jgi:hypothetical protein
MNQIKKTVLDTTPVKSDLNGLPRKTRVFLENCTAFAVAGDLNFQAYKSFYVKYKEPIDMLYSTLMKITDLLEG